MVSKFAFHKFTTCYAVLMLPLLTATQYLVEMLYDPANGQVRVWLNGEIKLNRTGAWSASNGYSSIGFGAHETAHETGSEPWTGGLHSASIHW